jgi:hypothetical protein
MRRPTQAEVGARMAQAKELGLVNEEGLFALGRYHVEGQHPDGGLALVFDTPVVASLEGPDLQPMQPPIMFDRTEDGRIILPSRWWQHTFEKVAQSEETPAEVRREAWIAAQTVVVPDAYLPSDTDTIEIMAYDRADNLVPFEALKPGTVCRIGFMGTVEDDDDEEEG